ncbi:MAG TPA: hypothetical protein VLJ60_06530, partial [bacterium]|nr:hypothetical protein [bacterium]
MNRKFLGIPLFILFLMLMIAGCTGGGEYLFQKTGEDFDAKGGIYKGVDGVTVHIPEGALPEGIDKITITIYALDTSPFTNVSKPVTNIYSISPAAIEFKKDLTVVIPYKETSFPNLLDELDLKPYFSLDRQSFEVFDKEVYQLDVENNIIKISTKYLGNFH